MERVLPADRAAPTALARLATKPVSWIVLLVVSGLCVFAVLRYFGDAFSVLDLDVKMSRDVALSEARRLVVEHKLVDVPLTKDAESFNGDSGAQTFIELEGGGKPALKPLLGPDEFSLYRWHVRLFSPGVEREAQLEFAPDGRPTGFYLKVPQAEAGAALSSDDARKVAVDTAAREWGVDFARYRPLTASQVTQPGKRVDHEFVYERSLEGAPPIGDGRLRLRLVVAGDRLIGLSRYVFVPEAFGRRYATLRSANNNIAQAASLTAGVLYGLGGCLIGTIWMMRRHAIRWAPAAKWAAVVALLVTGAALSSVSGSWFRYDTATSEANHRFVGIVGALSGGVVTWLLLTVVFGAAEGLGRIAFGDHPQLWRAWRQPAAHSRAIWGRTLAGYAWIGFDLAFIALFYYVVDRWLGWWSPSDALIDPNILGRPQPWLGPVSMALQAGMLEESLFRAVPLAGAALLGRRFGRERLFIGVALVLQAIVFGCAHANYPGQPAYARPVELFVPALVWGIVYLRYGLVPGILFHFGFDLTLMSIPLFVTDAPGLLVDRALVIAALATPLVVLSIQRVRAGRLIDLPASERNAAGDVSSAQTQIAEDAVVDVVTDVRHGLTEPAPVASSAPTRAFARRDVALLVILAIVGAVGFGLRVAQPLDVPSLAIDRGHALAIAENALATRGIRLDDRWRRSVRVVALGDGSGATFAWKEGGAALFRSLVGKTISPPHWEVRFSRFEGDVAERDSWRVVVVDDSPAPDGLRLIEHDVPESRPGARLDEAAAQALAEKAIADWLKRPASTLRRVSARSIEQTARVDWEFVYADPSLPLPQQGESRIIASISGDEMTGVGRAVFVPEAWSRDQRKKQDAQTIPRAVLALFGFALVIALVVSLVRRLARGEASKGAAWVVAALVGISLAIDAALDVNVAQFGFTVAQPFGAQLLRYAMLRVGTIVVAMLAAALFAAVGTRIASRVDVRRDGQPWWRRWAAPIAFALLAAGAGGYATILRQASSGPRLPAVGAADSLASFIPALLNELTFASTASVALLVGALLAVRKRWLEVVLVVGVVGAGVLARASMDDATPSAIVGVALVALVAWYVYRTLVRDHLEVVAPTLLCLALLGQVAALFHPGYLEATRDTILAIGSTIVGYRIWRWLVDRDRAATREAPSASPES